MMEFELLDGLSPPEQRQFIAACTPRKFRRRDIVCHEGDPGDCVHLIMSGRLVVRVTTPLGHTATLTILGPGEMFGEQALLSPDARRTATIVAVTDAETLTLNRTQLERLRADHPQVERFLTTSLAAQVRRLSAAVLEALYLPVETRVLRRLAHLATVYREPNSAPPEIRLTQEDLASMAGTTRATANKVLRDLENQGIVHLGRGTIIILDHPRLTHKAR
ncbi:Crp/Fnr family transcriptional regulator [Nocardia inohanensis]|uniref:Crp/Fnr family transcriptional regulator n=1 Tax=Nocardia inohanensis TaxID=209246 RepID=UPI0008378213|nr:Crp/Fnr family transcriptional regulator [Nocardia inohanensis]